MSFDPALQDRENGPLTQALRDRLIAAKDKHRLSFWRFAGPTRLSGSFLGNVSRGANISTTWVKNIVAVIEFLEAFNAGDPEVDRFLSAPSATDTSSIAVSVDRDSLEHAFNILKKNGVQAITLNL
jgi:hypothetical protein